MVEVEGRDGKDVEGIMKVVGDILMVVCGCDENV